MNCNLYLHKTLPDHTVVADFPEPGEEPRPRDPCSFSSSPFQRPVPGGHQSWVSVASLLLPTVAPESKSLLSSCRNSSHEAEALDLDSLISHCHCNWLISLILARVSRRCCRLFCLPEFMVTLCNFVSMYSVQHHCFALCPQSWWPLLLPFFTLLAIPNYVLKLHLWNLQPLNPTLLPQSPICLWAPNCQAPFDLTSLRYSIEPIPSFLLSFIVNSYILWSFLTPAPQNLSPSLTQMFLFSLWAMRFGYLQLALSVLPWAPALHLLLNHCFLINLH